jgi:hypothetical protein
MNVVAPCSQAFWRSFARVAFLALVAFCLLAGCSDSTTVSGTVTMDGQPVKSGAITFVKTDGDLVRAGAVISDGAFQAKLAPGKYRIELTGQKVVGKRKQKAFDGTDEEVELTEELFPERYNAKTELSHEIKPGPNKIDLKLNAAAAK